MLDVQLATEGYAVCVVGCGSVKMTMTVQGSQTELKRYSKGIDYDL